MKEKKEKREMNVQVRSKESVYLEINGYTYYIDDSISDAENEVIIERWLTNTNHHFIEVFTYNEDISELRHSED